jgi:ubiquinone/menaquinone biosynthesis C-methylase UbiE
MNLKNLSKKEVWDTIAESFDTTRRKPWDICLDFIKNLDSNSIVVDLGCGNGRHLLPCAQHCKAAIGADISRNLLKIVQKKVEENEFSNILLIQSDLISLPIKNSSFDAALFIASLHNIKGRENRIKALKEMYRILKKDGVGLISVWSKWQDRFRKHFILDLMLFPFKYVKDFGKHEFGDIKIFWKQHKLNVPRFYHLYSRKEIKRDVKNAGFEIIEIKDVKIKSTKYPDNYFLIVKKKY